MGVRDEEEAGHWARAYARWWVLQQCFFTVAYGQTGEYVLAPLHLGLLVWPCKATLVVAHLGFVVLRVYRLPFEFNGDFWAAAMDFAMVVVVVTSKKRRWEEAVEEGSIAVREQLCAFYAGASIWKINTSFLSPRTSCSSILFVQLVLRFWPTAPESLTTLAAKIAPAVTIFVEAAVGGLLARLPHFGVALGVVLHLLIALVPGPNNAGGFSVQVATRYFLYLPRQTADALKDPKTLSIAVAAGASLGALATKATGGAHLYFTDASIPVYGFMTVVLLVAVLDKLLGGRVKNETLLLVSGDELGPHKKKNNRPQKRIEPPVYDEAPRRVVRVLKVGAYVYAFGLVSIGLQDMANTHMFSNLRAHGGSNHLFLPTGLLFDIFRTANPKRNPFAGGVVRIDSTNSTFLTGLYPHEVTHLLTEDVKYRLAIAGHLARQWFPLKARIFGGVIHGPNVPYTVPPLEFRRLVAEAHEAAEEPFFLTYGRLGVVTAKSAKTLRRTRNALSPDFPVVRYAYHPPSKNASSSFTCTVTTSIFDPPSPCRKKELVLLPPPNPLLLKFSLFYPIPYVPGETISTEMPCADP